MRSSRSRRRRCSLLSATLEISCARQQKRTDDQVMRFVAQVGATQTALPKMSLPSRSLLPSDIYGCWTSCDSRRALNGRGH
jgi:hypothetical protein